MITLWMSWSIVALEAQATTARVVDESTTTSDPVGPSWNVVADEATSLFEGIDVTGANKQCVWGQLTGPASTE